MTFARLSTAGWRVLTATAVSAAFSIAAVTTTFAATVPQPTGNVVGTVTCGPAEETPAAQALVSVAGIDLATHADGTGKFTLLNVPIGQPLTIEALSDPTGSAVSSRVDISLQAGETLDVGNLDLAVCPTPAPPAQTSDEVPQDYHDVP